MKDKIRLGLIGLGRRGSGLTSGCFSQMKDVEIAAVCDQSENRMRKAVQVIKENSGYEPAMVGDYHQILQDPTIDAVAVMIGWHGRIEIVTQALRAGKRTAFEVGCADTLEECFDLVKTYEETGVPVMLMENSCYGRREMMLLNMIEKGLFGELVHATGGYMHYLDEVELFRNFGKEEIPHYRLEYYMKRNRENYPTHELGPICKMLKINRGNRMVRLNSVASKAVGIRDYAAVRFGADSEYAKMDYQQGDIIDTMITCAGGETIHLTLDTTLPRGYYSRNISLRGTRGMTSEDSETVYLVDRPGEEKEVKHNEAEMMEKYDHPLRREYQAQGVRGPHNSGNDWLLCRAFVESVKNETNPPIDAYDAAAWICIGALSEESIRLHGAPVEIPDFTNGKWEHREPVTEGKYCLDKVCEVPEVQIY